MADVIFNVTKWKGSQWIIYSSPFNRISSSFEVYQHREPLWIFSPDFILLDRSTKCPHSTMLTISKDAGTQWGNPSPNQDLRFEPTPIFQYLRKSVSTKMPSCYSICHYAEIDAGPSATKNYIFVNFSSNISGLLQLLSLFVAFLHCSESRGRL